MYLLMGRLARSLDAECGGISFFKGGHEIGYFHSHNIDERFETNLCSTPKRRRNCHRIQPVATRLNLLEKKKENLLSLVTEELIESTPKRRGNCHRI